MPAACPQESHAGCLYGTHSQLLLAPYVNLQRASLWHPKNFLRACCSSEREPPAGSRWHLSAFSPVSAVGGIPNKPALVLVILVVAILASAHISTLYRRSPLRSLARWRIAIPLYA